jgi:o-succinylbenzoate---CoA ligase
MGHEPVCVLDVGQGSAGSFATMITAALDGRGPALLPLPAGPPAARAALVAALRPGQAAVPAQGRDPVLVVPTSGSTGEPKAAVLGADALRASVAGTAGRLGGHGRWVLALPLTHVAGLMVLVRSVVAGTSAVPVDAAGGFDPVRFAAATDEAAAACAADGFPLYTALVPTQLARLLEARTDLRRYAAILLGAAAADPALLARAAAAGATVVVTYGMTETCGGCVSDGVGLDGVGVELDAGSRILLSGPMLFSGYRLRPDLTAQALDGRGRLVTADLGRLGPDGRLQVLGRVDDVIVSGGEKVVPAHVESVVSSFATVAACAVVGVPDRQWGQRVVAVTVPRPGQQVPSVEAVRAAGFDKLPASWLPRQVVAAAALPMLASGKVDRAAVRRLAVAGTGGPDGT